MMEHRDRASGWKHAKLTGHRNEDMIKQLLDENPDYACEFLRRLGKYGSSIRETSVGGLHETDVPGVNGGRKTKSKTDLKLFLHNGEEVNISIKKSLAGQVYFVRVGLFIDTFEKQFGERIPETVQRAMSLFWAGADDAPQIIEEYADRYDQKSFNLQTRHRSLNAVTLANYDRMLYQDLLQWFVNHMYQIAKLCFAMGAVRYAGEWSDFVWYKNMLGENIVDDVFRIEDICMASQNAAMEQTYYGDTNGGTTIQLPFGFVQWHQGQMQFHHKYEKINYLLSR